MLPLDLYARVRNFYTIAHETAGAARTRSSLRPLVSRGQAKQHTSGAMRREKARSYPYKMSYTGSASPPAVIARLDRAIQYSSDSSD